MRTVIKKKTTCQMCGEETNYDKKLGHYFCTKCVYAGVEANVVEVEEIINEEIKWDH